MRDFWLPAHLRELQYHLKVYPFALAVYSYGNIIGFAGYSGILNAGKWGVTEFNTSVAMTKINGEEKNTFVSPSITAFYTKPFKSGKRLTISPELYIISTPLLYSTVNKVTTTDRTFSAFIGSGFDYQLTKRFKFNVNYKANLSTNPDFPILSFFLIGSKINLEYEIFCRYFKTVYSNTTFSCVSSFIIIYNR